MACFNLRRGSLQNDVVRSVHFQLNSTCSTECSWFWYQVTDCHISHQGLSPRISLHLEAIFLAWILTRFFSCFRAFAGGSICPFSGQALVSKNHWIRDSSTIYHIHIHLWLPWKECLACRDLRRMICFGRRGHLPCFQASVGHAVPIHFFQDAAGAPAEVPKSRQPNVPDRYVASVHVLHCLD